MARHSHTRCWLHIVWSTHERIRTSTQETAAKVSAYLARYAASISVYHKINYVNPEHVHVLLDLPPSLSLEQTVKLLKGSSSHWINKERLVVGRFSWARGYGAFSVSHSNATTVARYIANQEQHHLRVSFADEFQLFVRRHGLRWHDEETDQRVARAAVPSDAGVNRDSPH